MTPLTAAVRSGNIEIVSKLIEAGANVDLTYEVRGALRYWLIALLVFPHRLFMLLP